MERFYDDSEDQDGVFGQDDETEFESDGKVMVYDRDDIFDMMQLDFVQVELKQTLLEKAIQVAKQKWFWSFRSTESQMKTIQKIYKELSKLTDQHEE